MKKIYCVGRDCDDDYYAFHDLRNAVNFFVSQYSDMDDEERESFIENIIEDFTLYDVTNRICKGGDIFVVKFRD